MALVGIVLLFVIAVSLLNRRSRDFVVGRVKYLFGLSLFLVFGLGGYFTYLQYKLWESGALQQFLLPPYQASYFYFYAFGRFFAPHLISLAAAFLFLWVAKRYNRKYEGRFFEEEEPYLGAISIFLVSHPGWIFYFPAVVVAYLLAHIYHQLRHGAGGRLPTYHLWVPIAIFVILISKYWISGLAFWSLLKI